MIRNILKINTRYFSNLTKYNLENMKNNKWHLTDNDPSQSLRSHKSNGQVNISKIPVIQLKEEIARCCGGHEILGHPTVYIKLAEGKNSTCKYCGLRYTKIN